METYINQFTFNKDELSSVSDSTVKNIIVRLEEGHVIYLSNMAFSLNSHEESFLSPHIIDSSAKNISYYPLTRQLRGCTHLPPRQKLLLLLMMERYYHFAKHLIITLLPQYALALEIGRTSYRPVEVKGRPSSYRKDDSLLHVDAFPSMPVQGRRILRVFSNVNPSHEPRVWNIGEPFSHVIDRFVPSLKKPKPMMASLLKTFHITKGERTPYDHYMLHLHNDMKADGDYQRNVKKETMPFPPHTSWIVFTDKTSHAALTGQYLLEQTFYLPIHAMNDEQCSPLRLLENKLQHPLLTF